MCIGCWKESGVAPIDVKMREASLRCFVHVCRKPLALVEWCDANL